MNNGNAIGIIELGSIYKGFAVQDAVLKSANVEKLIARTICSGKYLMIVRETFPMLRLRSASPRKSADFQL